MWDWLDGDEEEKKAAIESLRDSLKNKSSVGDLTYLLDYPANTEVGDSERAKRPDIRERSPRRHSIAMNKKRKILTALALISFILIVIFVGYGQEGSAPYHGGYVRNAMQIRQDGGGLTPFGTCLSVLIVSYIALFALLADKKDKGH